MTQQEINKLILKAHYNLTRKKGRAEYAPTTAELQVEINKLIQTNGKI